MASFADIENAGGNCKSWNRKSRVKKMNSEGTEKLTSTTAPRYTSSGRGWNALLTEAVAVAIYWW